MKELTTTLFIVSLLLPLLVLVAAAVIYAKFRIAQVTNQRRSVTLFILGIALVGIVFIPVGIAVGIEVFCAPGAGAQCGFGGVFFTGPIAFSVAAAIYLWLWARRGKAA